jgi:SsrA-binding protein
MPAMTRKGKNAGIKGAAAEFRKTVCRNRKALHEYTILEQLEAGLVLLGSEVKSLRGGHASISEAYCKIIDGEAFLFGVTISEYPWAHQFNHEPDRRRKLLLHDEQLVRLLRATREKGITLIPLEIYFNERGRAKCLVALAKGKREYDRRESIKKRDEARDHARLKVR